MTDSVRGSKDGPTPAPRRRLNSVPQFMALERRLMFDGAAAPELVVLAVDTGDGSGDGSGDGGVTAEVSDALRDGIDSFAIPVAGSLDQPEVSGLDDTSLVAGARPVVPTTAERESLATDSLAAPPVLTVETDYPSLAFPSGTLDLAAREILFVDSSVTDWSALIDGTRAGIQIVLLDAGGDAWQQMTDVIAQYQGITSVHIVSHGSDGSLILGGQSYGAQALDQVAGYLQDWQSHLDAEADILLYGCDIGAGEDGQILLDSLARITGADVAASTDTTGAEALGGDWVLERQTGAVDTSLFSTAVALSAYEFALAAPVNTVPDTGFLPIAVGVDTLLAFTGSRQISVADADGSVSKVTLSVGHGTLSVTASGATVTGSGSGQVQISGTLADINTTLASLTYQGTSGYHGRDTLTVQSIDGSSNTDTDTVAIGVAAQVPVLSIDAAKSVQENAAASALTATALISDDAATFLGGEIRVSGADAQDTLSISTTTANTSGAIRRDGTDVQLGNGTAWTTIGTISGGAGNQLRITFSSSLVTATVAENVVKAITFSNNSDNPVTSRTLKAIVLDSDGAPSAEQSITVSITPVNDAPRLTIDSTKTVSENDPASTLVPGAVLIDADSASFSGGVVTVSGLATGDIISLSTTTNHAAGAIWLNGSSVMRGNGATSDVIGTLSGGSGGNNLVITFTSAAVTPAIAERVVASLTFYNNSDTPVTSRALSLTVSDGGGGTSTAQTVTVNITPVNDTPTLAVDVSRTFAENVSGAALFSSVSLADLDSTDFNGGGIVITDLDTADVISISTTANNTAGAIWLSGSSIMLGNGTSSATIGTLAGGAGATLRITFTSALATPTVVANVVRALTFSNSADNPVASRTLRVTVNDGDGATSTAASTIVAITRANDAPVISTPATNLTLYTSSGSPTPPTGAGAVGLSLNQLFLTSRINDPDGTSWSNMGIAITGIAGASNLTAIWYTVDNGVTWVKVSTTGAPKVDVTTPLVLANTPSTRIYFELKNADAGKSLTFSNFLTLYAWDQSVSATSGTYVSAATLAGSLSASSVNVDLVVAPGTLPVNTLPASYTVNEDSPLKLSGISVTDPDGNASFSIKLSIPTGQGVLAASSTASVTVTGSGTNVLTLTGSLANLNTFLADSTLQPTFTPAANSTTSVTLGVLSTDSTGLTASGNIAIAITAVNDAPGLDLNGLGSGADNLAGFTEGGGGVRIATNATISDIDTANLTAMTVTLAARPDGNDKESLSVGTPGGLTWNYDAATGVLTLSGSTTVSTYETALRSITYANTSPAPTLTPRTVAVTATDGTAASTQRTAVINMTAVNSPPVLSATIPDQSTTAGLPFSFTLSNTAFTDPEGDTLSYKVSLADGSALPSWLAYNPTTRVFSGVSPTAGSISIRVTATDPNGASTTASFEFATQSSSNLVAVSFPKVYNLVNLAYATDSDPVTTDLYTGYYGIETNNIRTDSAPLSGSNFTFYQSTTAGVFSGNNIPGFLTYLDANGQLVSIAGYATRPVKAGGTVEGVYFVVDGDGVSNTTAGNTAYLLVINESFFASSTAYNSSSDPIDAALNDYFLTPSVSISGGSVSEGGDVTFTVTRSSSVGSATVQYASTLLAGDTASYADFAGVSGTVSFAAGETTKTITVKTTQETVYEADETFTLSLSNPSSGLRLGTSDATGIILNNDISAEFSVANTGAVEGNAITFTVTRTGDAQSSQTVSYVTSLLGSDTAALDDFTLKQGTLTFQAGETQKTVTILTTQDSVLEEDETFTLVLSNATGGGAISATAGHAVGTIENDEGVVIYSVADVTVSEATGQLTFTVTRSGDVAANQSISYSFSPGTATSGTDYAAVSGTLNFVQGMTSQSVNVTLTNDSLFESTETFQIALGSLTSVVNTRISSYQSSATGWITDNDPAPSFSVADAQIDEGGRITFVVTRTGDAQDSVTIAYNTFIGASDTASTIDFASASGTLSFAQGEMTKTVTIQTFSDIIGEANETFSIKLAVPDSATASRDTATGTIVERAGTVADAQNSAVLGATTKLSGTLADNSLDVNGASLTYAITGGTAASFTSGGITYDLKLVGTFGTLYLVSTGTNRGQYLYVPEAGLVNALDSGDARQDSFTLAVRDANSQTLEQTVLVNITGGNDRPVVDLQPTNSGTIDRSLSFALNGSPVAFASAGTNITDADGAATLASLAVRYLKSEITDGSREVIVVSGKSTVSIDLSADSAPVSFTLVIAGTDTDFTYSVSSSATERTLTLALASGAAMTLAQAEAVIDALSYQNSSTPTITAGTRQFSFEANDGLASNSPLAVANVFVGATANSPPTVSAGSPSATLVEAGGVANGTAGTASATIALTKGDVDGTASYDAAWLVTNGWTTGDSGLTYSKAGTYGTATLTLATGVISYALDDSNSATQALTAGQSVSDSFAVQVSDGTATASTTASFAITGADDASVLAADTGSGSEDTTLTVAAAAGVLANDSDVDNTLAVASFIVAGDSTVYTAGQTAVITGKGSVTLNADGSYSFVPVANWNGTVPQVSYTTSTGSVSTLDITIAAVNDASVLSSDSRSLTETDVPLTTSGRLTLTDADAVAATVVAQTGTIGSYGTFAIDASGAWTYTTNGALDQLDAGQVVTDTFAVATSDGGTAQVTVTITGSADFLPALTVQGVRDVSEGSNAVFSVSLSGSLVAPTAIDLALSGSTAIASSDYASTFSVFYYPDANAGTDPISLEVIDGRIILPVSIVRFYVSVATLADSPAVYEGIESFALSASLGGSLASAEATVRDDGAGTLFDRFGKPVIGAGDDDRVQNFNVSEVTVNEGSPYAVFRVEATDGDSVILTLFDGEGAGNAQARLGEDFGKAGANGQAGWGLQYFNGEQWADYQPGSTVRVPDAGALLLVRVPIINDAVYEGSHSFVLQAATSRGGSPVYARGKATIGDFGAGAIFNETGAENRTAAKDDDRSIQVSLPIVNEGSPYAVFTVAAEPGPLALQLQASDGEGRAAIPLTIGGQANLQYWSGTAWVQYDGTSARVPDGGVLLVRVAIGAEQDDQREGGETFSLLVRRGTILSEGRAEIRDDGTGISYSGDVSNGKAVASTVGLDDDFDRDGIAPTVEEMLATMVASQGTGSIGDINGDGFQDAEQSALATLAWVTEGNFRAANEGTLTEIKPIIAISVTRSSANDGSPPVDVSSQLTNIAVLPYAENSSGGGMPNPSGTMADGSIVDAPWDPIVFGVQAKDSSQQLADSDATRAGTQTRVYIDISRAGVRDGEFNAYYKYVSAEVLEATASNGGLRDLDGKAITQPGWYDFTQRKDAAGVYVGDGARFVVDQGRIIGIELNFTDNAFGDNDPALNRINDPGVPVHVTAPPPKPVIPPPVFDQARLSRPELLAPAVLPVEDFGQQYQPLRFDSALYPLLAGDIAPDCNVTEPLFAEMPRHLEAAAPADDNSGAWKIAVVSAPLPELSVFRAVEKQTIVAGKPGVFAVPGDAFAHSRSDVAVRLGARMASGAPLPAWIRFNRVTGEFVYRAPPGLAGEVLIRVTATDALGNEASITVVLQVAPEGPAVSAAPAGRSGFSDQLKAASGQRGLVATGAPVDLLAVLAAAANRHSELV